MPHVKKAIIIGSGPAGLSTALHLQQKNHIQCTVYELRPEPITLGGAIGIPSNGLRLLDRLGVYETLTKKGSLEACLIQHSISGSLIGEADWTAYVKEKIGYGYMRVKRRELVDVLLDAVQQNNIPVHYGKRIVEIRETDEEIIVTFSDGTRDAADLLIGCDGIHSEVRKLYVDPDVEPAYTGFSAFFSIVPTSSLPEELVPKPGMHVTFTTKGLFTLIPCSPTNDELFWFFSRETPVPESEDSRDGWEVRKKEEVGKFQDILLDVLDETKGEWGATLRAMVKDTGSVQFFPVFHLPEGRRWTNGRCILIGDAAHAMAPHAGQGVSMALEDVFALSRVLEDGEGSLEDGWRRYEGVRRPRIEEVVKKAVTVRDVRKAVGPWGLWLKEVVMTVMFGAYHWLGLGRWGLGQGILDYDIEEVDF